MMPSDSQDSLLREKERRNSPRIPINQLVYVAIAPGNGGLLVDLGEEGMCISVSNPLALPTEIHFSFTLEGHRTVQGNGRVCWRWQPDKKAGVQFVGLSSDLRTFIRKWLGIGNAPESLMFLPGSSKPMQDPLRAEQEAASDDGSQGIEVLRLAIASIPSPTNNKPRHKGILLGTAVCAILILLGVMIHNYPGTLPGLAWLTPIVGTQPASEPVDGVGPGGSTQSAERSQTDTRDGPPGQPIRNTTILYGPNQNETRFPVEVTDASNERWQATVTNENLTLGKTSDSIAAPGLGVQLNGLMKGVLRNDGALVEEGARPSAPSNPGNRKSVPQPVVVEAMIGSDGAVRTVQLISSADSKLAGAVVAAVRQWRYRPLYEKGQAIEFAARITFDFSGPGPQGEINYGTQAR